MERDTDLLAVVDMGTSGCKVLLFDPSGEVASSGFSGYANRQIPPDRVEQDPRIWWQSVSLAARQALEKITAPGRDPDPGQTLNATMRSHAYDLG